jgi:hypothetical protein
VITFLFIIEILLIVTMELLSAVAILAIVYFIDLHTEDWRLQRKIIKIQKRHEKKRRIKDKQYEKYLKLKRDKEEFPLFFWNVDNPNPYGIDCDSKISWGTIYEEGDIPQ